MSTKVLVLHGYRECAYYTYRKMAPIIAGCGDRVQFYFLDAPMIMVPADPKAHFGNTTDARYTLKSVPTCSTPTMYPPQSDAHRAWFLINDTGRDSLPGIEESWSYLRQILKLHKFDAIFGFSQGAAMAEQIAAMLERPYLFPMFCENGVAPHPPFKFVACVSGFLIRGPKLTWESYNVSRAAMGAPEFGFAKNTPTLYVVGRNDIVVPLERSHIFAQHSLYKRVEEHHGGHFIPMQTKWRQFFISFFMDPFSDIPSPTPASITTAATADDDEALITTLPVRTEPYQIGQTLFCPAGHRDDEPEYEERPHFFSVVYDSDSDSESDDHISPPDTPFVRTPQLPVLELEEPGIVDSETTSKFDSIDGVADRLSGTLSAKSKL
ncbi:hypothetical protein GYMLUDRAFT_247068 [Collybiopsis luxurians FD-317 M1]|uniref:Serine hydrolase domain-containing protein n=1 Tax=Collybiopsis luxurians FD-317 M1 TaxID=944289 RepID=A0A0D0BQL9_9AGAR|nr:hypothetical protein GYMLUDRAFT_247068 [Collybiopsis luxurians FD-317 M1]